MIKPSTEQQAEEIREGKRLSVAFQGERELLVMRQ